MPLGDLIISASFAQNAIATPLPTIAMNPHADSHRHPTVGAGHTAQAEKRLP
jgi:hypothetical protein